jgi:hypothetical protein
VETIVMPTSHKQGQFRPVHTVCKQPRDSTS